MARPKGSRNKKTVQGKGALRATMENKDKTTKETQTDDQAPTALTPEQQAIARRVAAESAEWEPITEESMHDFSLAISPLSLKDNFPEAWKQQEEKRYAFRWCERTDRRIDELTRSGHPITRWKICTRTTTPFLAHYIDNVLGCIARLDQVLLFRPWERHLIEKRAKNELAEARANAGQAENVAMKRAQEGVEAFTGPKHKIGSHDDVQYEDTRADIGEDIGDLVVES